MKNERGYVHLVGVGPGDPSLLTLGAVDAIRGATEIWCQDLGPWDQERMFLRDHLAGKKVVNVSAFYGIADLPRDAFYFQLAERLVHLAAAGRTITYLWSGNPLVWADTPTYLKRYAQRGELDLRITPGVSFLDVIWAEAPIHAADFQVRHGFVTDPDVSTDIDCVVGQVGDVGTTGQPDHGAFHAGLRRLYPLDHPVFVTGAHPKHGGSTSRQTTVEDLPDVLQQYAEWFYTLIIPRIDRPRRGHTSARAAALTAGA